MSLFRSRLVRTARLASTSHARAFSTAPTAVALVGCGLPGRGMGWYHAKQILEGEVPSAKLTDVVEPWFMGGGAGNAEFDAFRKESEAKGVRFHASIADMPKPDGKKLALISTRTADMPQFVNESIENGISHVFLEKPGAPTVGELETMNGNAKAAGVEIYMGYNKNVTAYITKGREALAQCPGADFVLVHHNAYLPSELDECFERNAEGILKNMAIHELAVLVTYFGVNAETVASVEADRAYSSCETRTGPSSGEKYTDFSKIGFTIKTTAGDTVKVYADRCGQVMPGGAMTDGAMMYAAVVKDSIIQNRAIMPDPELNAVVAAREAKEPGYMPYFYLQHDDYITLKERVCAHIASGAPGGPEGIASLQVGIDTLKLAEMLKPTLEKQLL